MSNGHHIEVAKMERPLPNFKQINSAIMNEVYRRLRMPKNMALGDGTGYNYSSAAMDHQPYFSTVGKPCRGGSGDWL